MIRSLASRGGARPAVRGRTVTTTTRQLEKPVETIVEESVEESVEPVVETVEQVKAVPLRRKITIKPRVSAKPVEESVKESIPSIPKIPQINTLETKTVSRPTPTISGRTISRPAAASNSDSATESALPAKKSVITIKRTPAAVIPTSPTSSATGRTIVSRPAIINRRTGPSATSPLTSKPKIITSAKNDLLNKLKLEVSKNRILEGATFQQSDLRLKQ